MLKVARFLLSGIVILILLPGCTAHHETTIKTGGPEIVSFRALPFPLTEFKLLSRPFLHATALDIEKLIATENISNKKDG
jgi:hypothetical protein